MNKTLHTEYGKIEYILQRKNMKNMRLKIDKGRIVVSCAKSVKIKNIEEFIVKHLNWIVETQKKIERKKDGILPSDFLAGETFSFLGNTYTLEIVVSQQEKAVLSGERLLLCVKEETLERKKNLFLKWLTSNAKSIMQERLQSLYPQFQRQIVKMPKLVIRKMKSRWGSANIHKHIITLNTLLVLAPVPCIDYVIVHELAHYIHANHSKDFYAVVAEHIPDWKQRRMYLNKQFSLDF